MFQTFRSIWKNIAISSANSVEQLSSLWQIASPTQKEKIIQKLRQISPSVVMDFFEKSYLSSKDQREIFNHLVSHLENEIVTRLSRNANLRNEKDYRLALSAINSNRARDFYKEKERAEIQMLKNKWLKGWFLLESALSNLDIVSEDVVKSLISNPNIPEYNIILDNINGYMFHETRFRKMKFPDLETTLAWGIKPIFDSWYYDRKNDAWEREAQQATRISNPLACLTMSPFYQQFVDDIGIIGYMYIFRVSASQYIVFTMTESEKNKLGLNWS